jgi:UDP-N-acetylglucosamine 2-epimerase
MTNPYGDGHAAEKIVQVLTNTPLTEDLIVKRAESTKGQIARA